MSFAIFATTSEITPLPTDMPIEVDLGCARGHFLEAMAQLYPERFFLGVERLKHRYEKTLRRIQHCPNIAVWRAENREAVETLLPKQGIDTIHISFPDPWPKRRHHPRRLVSEEFLQKCSLVLTPQGLLRLMTDHLDYFRAIQTAVRSCGGFLVEDCKSSGDGGKEELPRTEFQKRFLDSGVPIYQLALRKI